jgi:hypothetical protein
MPVGDRFPRRTRRKDPTMNHRAADLDTLLKLETWQEDLLARLDELDKRVEEVLRECQIGYRPTDPGEK